MELLFESRQEVGNVSGKAYPVQGRARLHPEPVLLGSNDADGAGVSCYGTVLREGGVYRLWYQAWPRNWNGENASLVAYAESTDGLVWRKPSLALHPTRRGDNNLTDLPFHSPAVFVDPTAPAAARYRATGYTEPRYEGVPAGLAGGGYYTAHSADGLHWTLDQPAPAWRSADVITSVWHPGQQRGVVSLKRGARVRGFGRRAIWQAECRAGQWSADHSALVPDDYDDICAMGRGFASADYYGMAMLPAGGGTAGFIWQFRHTLPRTGGAGAGVFGATDVTLAYQAGPGDRWLHQPGRPDFISHGALPWTDGGTYTAAASVMAGDEQRLYFCGALHSHGWYVDENWKISEPHKATMIAEGFGRIGFASWPCWRLFGFRGDPVGALSLALPPPSRAVSLHLNCEAEPGGSVRVELPGRAGFGVGEAVPLAGDQLAAPVAWTGGTTIVPVPGATHLSVRLHLDRATVWAWELRDA